MKSKIHLSEDDKRQILYNFDKYGKQWSLISRYTGFKESTIRSFVKQYQKTGQLTSKRGPRTSDPSQAISPDSLEENSQTTSSHHNDLQSSSADNELNEIPQNNQPLIIPQSQTSIFPDQSRLSPTQLPFSFPFPQDSYQNQFPQQNVSDPTMTQNQNYSIPMSSITNPTSKPYPDSSGFPPTANSHPLPQLLSQAMQPMKQFPPTQLAQTGKSMIIPPNDRDSYSQYLAKHLIDSANILSFQFKNFRDQIDFFLNIVNELKAQAELLRSFDQPMSQMMPQQPLPMHPHQIPQQMQLQPTQMQPQLQQQAPPQPATQTQSTQQQNTTIAAPQDTFSMTAHFDSTADDQSFNHDANHFIPVKDPTIPNRIMDSSHTDTPVHQDWNQSEVFKLLASIAGDHLLSHRNLIQLYNKLFSRFCSPLTRDEKRNKTALIAKLEHQKEVIMPYILSNQSVQVQIKQIVAQDSSSI